MLFKVILVPARKTSNTKLYRQNLGIQTSKFMIIVIASHYGHGCNRRIELIILAQEPCLNSIALLRYGQKSRINFLASCTIFTTENRQNFLPYPDD